MNFVITMAGLGLRFKNAGYKEPKMLIKAFNKTLLEWALDSLPLDLSTNLVFIGLKEHKEIYNLENFIRKKYGKFNPKFLWLDNVTRGQAETVYKAKNLVDFDTDLIIYNIDTYFQSKTLKRNLLRNNVDGVLVAFKANDKRYSYAKIDENGYILETVEKEVISDYALTGFYHFKYPSDFFEVCEKYIKHNITIKNEFYIAPMYNDLIKKGKKFIIDTTEECWILGTPEELEYFMKNYK